VRANLPFVIWPDPWAWTTPAWCSMPAVWAVAGDAAVPLYGLLGLGVLAMTLLPRLFRRFPAKQPAWIGPNELQCRLAAGDQVMLLDVRQPDEFNLPPGHLPGAVNVPLAELADRTPDLARRKQPIVVVCKTDRRSARAAAEWLAAGSPGCCCSPRRRRWLASARAGAGISA
jgi:rhodanese-related sulfurtransferase